MIQPHRRPRVLYLSHAPDAVYAVMRPLAEPGLDLITLETNSDEERIGKLADADAVIVAAFPFSRALIEAARDLKFVQHQGVGFQDTIDMDVFRQTGARLAITPAGTTIGVAEHTLLLTLAVLRRLSFADAELRQGRWHINALRPESMELAHKTVGYIGMGRIGQAAAKRFNAFETRGVYYDPSVRLDAEAEAALGVASAELDDVFRQADILTLHVPLIDATRHIVSERTLALMKPEALIINTSRGSVIDEAALIAALQAKRISGAGLDVFEIEPPSMDSPLMGMHNTVLTPHISAGTRDALATKMEAVFANLHRFFAGEPLENEVAL